MKCGSWDCADSAVHPQETAFSLGGLGHSSTGAYILQKIQIVSFPAWYVHSNFQPACEGGDDMNPEPATSACLLLPVWGGVWEGFSVLCTSLSPKAGDQDELLQTSPAKEK